MDPETQKKIDADMKIVLKETLEPDPNPPEWVCPSGYTNKRLTLKAKTRQGEDIEVAYEQLTPDVKNDITIVQFHGGAYIVPLINSYKTTAVDYSKLVGGAEVFSLDYRVDKYPSALEDAIALYNHLLQSGYDNKKMYFFGDSSGAHLALTTILYFKEKGSPLPSKTILLCPYGNAADDSPCMKYNWENDVFLGAKGLLGHGFCSHYFDGVPIEDKKKDYLLSPIYGDYKGFPKTLIQYGTYDLFLDDCKTIAEKMKKEGVDVKVGVYEYMSHDFQIDFLDIEPTARAWEEMKQFANE